MNKAPTHRVAGQDMRLLRVYRRHPLTRRTLPIVSKLVHVAELAHVRRLPPPPPPPPLPQYALFCHLPLPQTPNPGSVLLAPGSCLHRTLTHRQRKVWLLLLPPPHPLLRPPRLLRLL